MSPAELSRDAIRAIDPKDMLGDVLEQPAHLTDALWRVESADIKRFEAPGGLAICGMGGSGIGADLAIAAIGDRAKRPISTVRGYELPSWVGEETAVLLSSHSGNTEETLSCYEAAGKVGAKRIAVTTGGKLAESARADGVPVIGIPSGMLPRAAVGYGAVCSLEVAAICGAAPSLRSEVDAAAALERKLTDDWGPDAPDDSLAKSLARTLHGSIPVIYGAGMTAAVARRWKSQVNENAKRHGFFAELPEADHNEICGWTGDGAAKMAAVFLEDCDQHPRERRRFDLTAEIVGEGASAVVRVETQGETRVERLLWATLLGDLVSLETAIQLGADPERIEALNRVKEGMAE
jgi:glucose/mannose-6-phosphate isomerase